MPFREPNAAPSSVLFDRIYCDVCSFFGPLPLVHQPDAQVDAKVCGASESECRHILIGVKQAMGFKGILYSNRCERYNFYKDSCHGGRGALCLFSEARNLFCVFPTQ